MSFILEALKKSEAERRQGEVPDLNSDPGVPSPRRRPLWPLLLTAALLLNGIVLGGWLLLGKEESIEKPVVVDSQGAVSQSADPIPASVEEARKERMPVPSAPTVLPPPALVPAAVAPSRALVAGERRDAVANPAAPRPEPVASQRPASAEEVPQPESARAMVRSAPTEPRQAQAATTSVVSYPPLSELSAEVRSRLPELNLQLHFYSPDPARRLVRLNGSNRREGSRGGDGLNVEEITPDGLRLSHERVRFFLPTAHR